MPHTQENRLIGIETPLGKDILLLRGFSGQEGISRLSNFDLDLLSHDPDIKFEEIIGKRVTLRVTLGSDKKRYFNGFISRFMQTGSDRGLANYRATMVPWLWFLTRTSDCRIFQKKTIPDIIEQIFKDLGFTDYKLQLQGSFQPRDYCVQYRETDFNFVSRLMEQYGLLYFFEHEKGKHTLVIANDPSAHQPCPEQKEAKWEAQGSGALAEDVITSFQWEQILRPGKYAVTDYNFETPSTSLDAEMKTTIEVGGNGKFEIYDYPGEYTKKNEGDTIAKLRMEEEETQYFVVSGTSSCRAFTSGYRFDLKDYVRKDMNRSYLLTSLHHAATVGGTYTTTTVGKDESTYTNSFTCVPHKVPFRPPQATPKPIIQGVQTAVVVGKAGEEIWTDNYGRVKVQFHWDREGKYDENSSCWTRVSQNWAGKQWGAMFLPRIGQEVIVEFLEGDPDRPIITGRVYNAEQMPPYPLPGEQTKSTIKSNSSKGGGGSNELRFEDKKGGEEIYLHGQKDWNIVIENDKSQSVGHDESLNVGNNRTKTVGVDQSETIGSNKTIKVGSNHTEAIGANKSMTVGGNHTETISGAEAITVGMASAHTIALARALTIGGAYQVTVGAAMNESIGAAKAEEIGAVKSVNVGGNSSEKVGANKSVDAASNISEKAGKDIAMNAGKNVSTSAADNISESAGKDVSITAGKKMTLDAGDDLGISGGKKGVIALKDELIIKCGSASISLKSNGDISITGAKISIKGSGDVVVKGSKVVVN
ncbi:MAG: type VI secretion system tip protein VgrG [Nitrospira defluvii]|nr:type VI secretion system tip protein VgrG [Nitrospira defluvii]